jgi:RNA-directed DNA polymerase
MEHLLGKINFVLQINPEDEEFAAYKKMLIDLKKKQDSKVKKPLLVLV